MGYYELLLGAVLIELIRNFLDEHDLGVILGADATLRPRRAWCGCRTSPSSPGPAPGRELPAEPVPLVRTWPWKS